MKASIRRLVAEGATLNTRSSSDRALLYRGCLLWVEQGHRDAAVMLIEAKADPNWLPANPPHGNPTDSTPLHYALSTHNKELTALLLDAKADALHRGAAAHAFELSRSGGADAAECLRMVKMNVEQ
eukprot:2520091-Prymnesium_polylepis.1